MALSSAYWLVAWRRSGFAMRADPHTFVHGARVVVYPGSIPRVCTLIVWAPEGA